jgi:multiple sugar transport system permease protein
MNKKRKQKIRDTVTGYLFISGFLLFYLVFTIYPLLQSFFLSLTKWNLLTPKIFVGLSNYINLLKESMFWSSIGHTVLFTVISVPAITVGGFLLALLVNHNRLGGKALYRATFFSPNVLSVSIISYLWLCVLEPYTGLLNNLLHKVGISSEILWLSNPNLVWVSMVIMTIWWTVGYNMLLYLSAMQDIPESLYESAELDGAGSVQKTLHITVPYLKNIHILIIFLQTVASFKIFGQVFLVTGGGPAGMTRTFIQYIYETGFQHFYIGSGTAASILLFLIILVVSVFQLNLLKESPNK